MKHPGIALAVALVFPTLMAWFYLVALAGDRGAPAPASPGRNPLVVVTYGAGKVLQFTFPLWYVWVIERRRVRPGVPHFQGLAFGLAFGVLAAVGLFVLYYVLAHHTRLVAELPAKVRIKVEEFGLASPATFILFAVFLSVVHSLLEEYYWRWFVFGRLRLYLSLWPAVLVSSLAFMAHHVINLSVFFPGKFWGMALPLSLCVAAGGAAWAWLYDRTGSVYSPWLSHLIVDGAILALGYELVFME